MKLLGKRSIVLLAFALIILYTHTDAQPYLDKDTTTYAQQLERLAQESDPVSKMWINLEIGESYKLLDVERARKHYQAALELAEKQGSQSDRFYFHERLANMAILSGNYLNAIRILDKHLPDVIESGDSILVKFHYSMGLAFQQLHAYDEAYDQFNQVVRLSDSLNNERMAVSVLGLIAKVYTQEEKFEEALELKKEAFTRTKKVDIDPILGYICKDLGNLFLLLDQVDSAEFYVKKALEISEERNRYFFIAGESYVVYSRILLKANRYPEAIKAGNRARDLADRTNAKFLELEASESLSMIYQELTEFELAIQYAENTQKLAKYLNSPEKLVSSYQRLQELYLSKKNFEKAFEYQSLGIEANKVLENYKDELAIGRQNIKEEQAKNLAERLKSSQENEIINLSKVYGFILFILLLTIILGLVSFRQKPLFTNVILDEALGEIEAELKVKFIKQSSLMMVLITAITILYLFMLNSISGMVVASCCLCLLGGLGLYVNKDRINQVFWLFISTGYLMVIVFPPLVGPLYTGFLALITIYLTLNYLAEKPLQYILNLSLLFISFVVYLYFLQAVGKSVDINSIGLEAITGIACTIAVVAIRYFSNTHAHIIREELQKNQDFLKTISDINPAILITKDLDSRITYANQYSLDLFGMKREEIIGKQFKNYESMNLEKEKWDAIKDEVLTGETIFSSSTPMKNADGIEKYFDVIMKPIYNDKHEIIGILTVGGDVTEKVKAKKSMEEREMILNSIINTLPDPVFVLGIENKWQIFNKAFPTYMNRIFGKMDFDQPNWISQFPEHINSHWADKVPMLLEGKAFNEAVAFKALDGKRIDLDVYQTALKDKDENKIGILFVGRDQTEKLAKDRLIKQQMQDLNEKNVELKKYIESNSHLEQFAYLASHDLRTPIRTLVSFTQLLKRRTDGMLGSEETEYMNFIIRASKNMMTLVNDILSFSRVNTSKVKLEQVELRPLLGSILEEMQVVIKEKEASIEIGAIRESIVADKIKMRQLFQNLISNALKFSKAGVKPEIHIYSEKRENYSRFWVKDNGIGIKEEYQKKIFLLFNRLHSDIDIEGFGIGLATCKMIVEQHEGEIGLTSEFGFGSCFYFDIPHSYSPELSFSHEEFLDLANL
ncbi:MAG: ATP-binding protein [Bacteroidia bacterium]|nr:ATP-binding protein [Bacteroidia bacterium]